jgi:tripartite-type tricarboxylate transporter receptor subunit TctC
MSASVKFVIRASLACALGLAAHGVLAQAGSKGEESYPGKLVRWVLPFSAGSGQDIFARQVAPKLAERLGQPVIIDNKAGAGGVIGFDYVAKAAPDGYQIMMGNNSLLILSAIRPTPYDPLKDFAPVMLMGNGYSMIMINQSVPVNSLAELIAYSRANPGKLNYSSPAVGTFGHLGTELFKMQTGADLVHIPHKGIVAAVQGLIAGDVDFIIGGADLAVPHIKSGKLRLLASAGMRRAPMFPDVPTTYELGYKDYDTTLWYGLLLPAGTRREIISRLHTDMSRILVDPAMKEDMLKRGIDTGTSTPEQFAALMKAEMATWQNVIKAGNIKAE